jgi:hypothetical protein
MCEAHEELTALSPHKHMSGDVYDFSRLSLFSSGELATALFVDDRCA